MTNPSAEDMPDTERCYIWHANRYLIEHEYDPEPCRSSCCPCGGRDDTRSSSAALNGGKP